MKKKTRIILATGIAAVAMTVGTGAYGMTTAFAERASDSDVTKSTPAAGEANPATIQHLREQVLEMLKDHMGINGPEAERLAAAMAEQMQGDDAAHMSEMIEDCSQAGDMMNDEGGANMMNGMMNDGSHGSHHRPSSSATGS